MNKTIFALAFLSLLVSNVIHAEVIAVPSIEWLTCQSEVVVVANIKQITTTKGPGDIIYEDCVAEIDEVIKAGDIKSTKVIFCLRRFSTTQTAKNFMNSPVLVFLVKSKDGNEAHLDNTYVPTNMYRPLSILDLSKTPQDFYCNELRELHSKDELLNLVRRWKESAITESVREEVPCESSIY